MQTILEVSNMTAQQQPVILAIDCSSEDVEEHIGNNNRFTELLFGVKPKIIFVSSDTWPFSKGDEKSFWPILREKANMCLDEVREWAETDDFVRFASKYLDDLYRDSGDERYNDILQNRLAVRIVLLGGASDITDSSCSLPLLPGFFPNACLNGIVSQQRPSQILSSLDISIGVLELGVRQHNALRRFGIETVGDLVNMSAPEVEEIPVIGRKSFAEIDDALKARGLGFKQE